MTLVCRSLWFITSVCVMEGQVSAVTEPSELRDLYSELLQSKVATSLSSSGYVFDISPAPCSPQ